jgi:hypothetical protein
MMVGGLLQTMHAPNPVFLAAPRYTARQLRDPFLGAVGAQLQKQSRDGDARVYLHPLRDAAAAIAGGGGKCVALRLRGYEPFEPSPCDANIVSGEP